MSVGKKMNHASKLSLLGDDLLALGLGFFIEKLIFLFRAVYGAGMGNRYR